ncbi:MAG: efflux RND transporter periplasmic adaptor subunit, partial [Bacteroidetes bacterium]|nr:efflux RND transporter periplasmic adaptor subunit [Bacteroidota bacterium]
MKQLIYIPLALLMFCSCHNSDKPAAPTAPSATAPDTVAAFVLHDTSVTKSIELPAELLPYEQAQLFSRVQGYIKEVRVDIGDKVHRGQTLALIEAPELQTKYAEFQSSLQAAKAKYMSSADLYQRLYRASQAKTPGIVAPVDLERSHNQLLADSASYESARKLAQSYREVADYLVIQAPFDGTITARSADRGAMVGNNQVVLTIQNNRTLRLRIAVPELYVASGTPVKETSFRVDAYPEKLFSAALTRKSGSIDAATRTELWEFTYNNQHEDLKAGTFAYVKLSLQRSGRSFVVPPSAIVTTQER